MTPEFSVQTAQEPRSMPDPASGSPQAPAVCLRSPRGGKLRVVRDNSEDALILRSNGWADAWEVTLAGACGCGCGMPLPHSKEPFAPMQKYADPENCRRAVYALMHPTLDLSGMTPEKAKRAARMAEEAVKAAKLGQGRATVDASRPVEHKALRPDPRQSCRLRVTPEHFEMLAEMQALGFHRGRSFSAIAMDLIEREVEDCRLRSRQEGEHDV